MCGGWTALGDLHLGCRERIEFVHNAEPVNGDLPRLRVTLRSLEYVEDDRPERLVLPFHTTVCERYEPEWPESLAWMAEPCPEMHDTWADPSQNTAPVYRQATESGWLGFYVCGECGHGWNSHYNYDPEEISA